MKFNVLSIIIFQLKKSLTYTCKRWKEVLLIIPYDYYIIILIIIILYKIVFIRN